MGEFADDFQLLVEFYLQTQRQGPGGKEQTFRAIVLEYLNTVEPLKIADIGFYITEKL